jgi:hypothetical protein
MAGMFVDSFDPYNDLLQKWSSGALYNFNTNPAFVRTGTQSLNPNSEAFDTVPRVNFGNRQTLIYGYAVYVVSLGPITLSFVYNQNAPAGQYGQIDLAGDGSLTLSASNDVIAATAPGIITAGAFFYIELMGTFTAPGEYELRVNGNTVLQGTGVMSDGAHNGVTGFFLPGNPEITVYYDDLYICDDTGGVNDGFQGPIQIYAILPDSNETPIDFTPLSGHNFSEVNQTPPPGDSAYVYSPTIGAVDQYHYSVAAIPGSYEITFIQHSLCCRLDAAGAHTVQSQVNNTTGQLAIVGNNTPTENYAYVLTIWDQNPNTGKQFAPTDFNNGTWAGPIITA